MSGFAFSRRKLTLPQNIFASRSLDTDVLNKSSSGGVAYELSKKILEIHGDCLWCSIW